MSDVSRFLKYRKLMLCFIGPYHILKRVGEVAYGVNLPPSLSNLQCVFHVSQLRKYVPDPSHIIQMDDVQVRDNLIVKASQLQIDDKKVKHLRGKDIILVKVIWGGHVGGIMTWELESRMRESYLELFRSGICIID
ncbi:uncharacterized protein LOC127104592 [Lathyrus oleraceus]|uniref:uncharacterized protein LOC127104592 n=1 Tax=Pisum sativum TaxID=3888 RepID=UPI0021CEC5F3|nr:uncharacterized protein LOC127104592 [Pisum sativum]